MAAPPPPPRGGFSLYDDLLDPSDSSKTTISSAPVLYSQNEASAEQGPKKPVDPALRFQPIRRPQVKQAKSKPSAFPKAIPKPAAAPAAAAAPIAAPSKSTLADWAATEDEEWLYGLGEKRQRGGRKNKRKKQHMQVETDWDEMYDPSRPTNVDEYLRSDEKIDEVREWKALLYRHRRKPEESDLSDEDDQPRLPTNQFAPPPAHAFAPPPPSPPQAPPPHESADDAYARRQAISTGQVPQSASPAVPPPPPPPPHLAPPENDRTSLPPSDSTVISQAPIRYTQALEPENAEDDGAYSPPPALGVGDDVDVDEAHLRSSRPGQAGFAQRLMSKYGWTKGTGLGADESGIVNPLRVQVEKRRKKADADGGGWAEPGGKGKIIGGKRREEEGRFGTMSEVIVLRNMLENMPDLQAEIEQGLGQEIGEECGEKYGRVERLYIDQPNRQVFIKFTNQVSALRAVNELDGRVFNGNPIASKFYDTEKFDKGIYS